METTVSPVKAPQLIPFQFKGETAKLNSIKGVEARRNRKLNPTVETVRTPEERFKEQRLTRVRKQLDALQDRFDEALKGELYVFAKSGLPVQVFDPQFIDRIAAAIARVAELERQLSDWALPGSKKPRPERSPRSSASFGEPDGE